MRKASVLQRGCFVGKAAITKMYQALLVMVFNMWSFRLTLDRTGQSRFFTVRHGARPAGVVLTLTSSLQIQCWLRKFCFTLMLDMCAMLTPCLGNYRGDLRFA